MFFFSVFVNYVLISLKHTRYFGAWERRKKKIEKIKKSINIINNVVEKK